MDNLLGRILTTENMDDLRMGLVDLIIEKFSIDFDNFRETMWMFDSNQIEELFSEALSEAKEEVKDIIKQNAIKRMLDKLDMDD